MTTQFDATQAISARLAATPRYGLFLLIVPLMLVAILFSGIGPALDTDRLSITLSLVVLSGAMVMTWKRRWLAARGLCVLALLCSLGTLLVRLAASPSVAGALMAPIGADAAVTTCLAVVVFLLTARHRSVALAAIRIFMTVLLVQYSITNLRIVLGDAQELAAYPAVSASVSMIHFMLAISVAAMSMLRQDTTIDEARSWPAAAAAAVAASLLFALGMPNAALAAAQTALSGALLVTAAFFGCRAAITRREMLRLHIGVKRRMLRLRRQSDELIGLHADYAELLENVPIGVMRTKETGQIQSSNSRMCEILGYDGVEQLTATDIRALFVDPERRRRGFLAWQNSGAREWSGDVEMLTQNGKTIIAQFTSCRVDDHEGKLRYVLSCYADVTEVRTTIREKEKLENDLRLGHRLEGVGRLAAGVAHEINTPMQYIGDNVHFLSTAYADLRALVVQLTEALGRQADPSSKARVDALIAELAEEADLAYLDEAVVDSFERTQEGVRSVASIVRSMKEFAYPNDKQRSPHDINELLGNTLTVSRSIYSTAAEIVTEFGELPATYCYPGELNQVFVNLVVNAAHAVEAANAVRDRPIGEIRIVTRLEDDAIVVTIADNGTGMPEAVRTRIFDPFFTTKEIGKGTGQGLAIAKSIITEKHGGSIDVTSTAGKGTVFTVQIPVCNTEMG